MSQFNDCQLEFYQANGATSDDLQDAQREWLIVEGFPAEHNQDMFFDYLLSIGLTGSYSDMRIAFWKTQNCYA